MRFIFAIVAFAVAAVLIGLGMAGRAVALSTDRVTLDTQVQNPAPYLVIDHDALAARPGKQTITLRGDGPLFLAYGRAEDVAAWIGTSTFSRISYDPSQQALVSETISGEKGEASTAPADSSPAGSDLWLDQFSGQGTLTATINVPPGVAVLAAGNGVTAAPAQAEISWPTATATPWVGPVIVAGAVFFIVGVVLLLLGFRDRRRSRGPRRNLPSPPPRRGLMRPLRSLTPRKESDKAMSRVRARRIALASALLVTVPVLTGCSTEYWPSLGDQGADSTQSEQVPTPSAAPNATGAPAEEVIPPAVTSSQMERIVSRIAASVEHADQERDQNAIGERFAGAALAARKASYTIGGALPDKQPPQVVPSVRPTLILPQQTDRWPRTVFTVTQNLENPAEAPTALLMVQRSPRENYRVYYETALAPDVQVPDVAPTSIGAPAIAPDSKLLMLPPGQLATAYGDVLLKGDNSSYAKFFDPTGDTVRQQMGVQGQQEISAGIPANASASFTNAPGPTPPAALATNDAGALVTVELNQTEKVTPKDGGSVGFESGGAAAALSGFTGKSTKGVQRVIGMQLTFYVPAVGSGEKIRLLGWSENLVAASEVQ